MKSSNFLTLPCSFILLICWSASLGQEINGTTSQIELPDSVEDESDIMFLIIQLSLKDENQNDSCLFYYWQSIENTDFSNSTLYDNGFLHYSYIPNYCTSGSLMYSYRKVDVSKSRNLNYKKLSEKYPKTFEEKHPWGGLLLYSIISSMYPNHGYAPVNNTK